jgi:hypothetical protein
VGISGIAIWFGSNAAEGGCSTSEASRFLHSCRRGPLHLVPAIELEKKGGKNEEKRSRRTGAESAAAASERALCVWTSAKCSHSPLGLHRASPGRSQLGALLWLQNLQKFPGDRAGEQKRGAGNAGKRPAYRWREAGEKVGSLVEVRIVKRCRSCRRRIWFWEARYILERPTLLGPMFFHGECACEWLLATLNDWLGSEGRPAYRRALGRWWL